VTIFIIQNFLILEASESCLVNF